MMWTKNSSERSSNRDAIEGHRVGDFVKFPTGQELALLAVTTPKQLLVGLSTWETLDTPVSAAPLTQGCRCRVSLLTDEKKNGKFGFFTELLGASRS